MNERSRRARLKATRSLTVGYRRSERFKSGRRRLPFMVPEKEERKRVGLPALLLGDAQRNGVTLSLQDVEVSD